MCLTYGKGWIILLNKMQETKGKERKEAMTEQFLTMYLEELEEIEPMTGEEEKSLLVKTAKGDQEARTRLVEGSLKKVFELAGAYEGRALPMSDLVQEANTALMLAAVEYEGGEEWEELLERRVKEGVELALKEQETEQQIEETMAARVNVLQKVSQMLSEELGREATVEELADRMKMTKEEIKDIMKLALDAVTVKGQAAGGTDL